jgi:uncharacterized repeat protein (TIGR03803 family)
MASDGNLYGVTQGTVAVAYKITMPAGTFSVLANLPYATIAPLIVGSDGNFYGTTGKGGAFNQGTVFQLTKKGVLKILYSFSANGTDGLNPSGAVLQAADGKLYGTTYWGGASGQGTVYSLTTTGASYKILHTFTGTDGAHPPSALVQGSDNFLYGATYAGGGLGDGVFSRSTLPAPPMLTCTTSTARVAAALPVRRSCWTQTESSTAGVRLAPRKASSTA